MLYANHFNCTQLPVPSIHCHHCPWPQMLFVTRSSLQSSVRAMFATATGSS